MVLFSITNISKSDGDFELINVYVRRRIEANNVVENVLWEDLGQDKRGLAAEENYVRSLV